MFNFGEVMEIGGRDTQRLDAISANAQARTTPINIQFTSGTTGAPKGATLTHPNIVNNASFVTAAMHFGRRPALHSGAALSLLRHGDGHAGLRHKGATMVFPGEGFDPARDAARDCGRALHRALRRADHVRGDARPSGLRELRPRLACAPASWPAPRARSRS